MYLDTDEANNMQQSLQPHRERIVLRARTVASDSSCSSTMGSPFCGRETGRDAMVDLTTIKLVTVVEADAGNR